MTQPNPGERQLDPAAGYRIFEELLGRVRASVEAGSPALAGYPRQEVGRRILQRIAELAAYPAVGAAAARYARGGDPRPRSSDAAVFGGLIFEGEKLRVTAHTWLRGFVDFAVQWTRVWACLAKPRTLARAARVTVVMGVGQADIAVEGSDGRFAEFCESGPLTPLCEATHLLIESALPVTSTRPERLSYAKHPLLALFRSRPPRGRSLFRFAATHFAAAASFLLRCLTHRLSCLIARDMAFHAVARDLDERRLLEAIVITNSNFQVQPLWMRALPGRRFKTHMVWYSQNTVPFLFKLDGVQSDLPHYRHVAVDSHWVWTEGYAAYVKRLVGGASAKAVGPILWYLPERRPAASPGCQVAIFDVTPVKESYARQIGLARNYYSTGNMIAFLGQAVAACEQAARQSGREVVPVLKHKRGYGAVHDPRYADFVDQLVASRRLRITAPHTNMYSLIGDSVAVIVVPYSSPAYVASCLGVRAIYLDATGSIEPTYEQAPCIDFSPSEAALAAGLLDVLRASGRRLGHA